MKQFIWFLIELMNWFSIGDPIGLIMRLWRGLPVGRHTSRYDIDNVPSEDGLDGNQVEAVVYNSGVWGIVG